MMLGENNTEAIRLLQLATKGAALIGIYTVYGVLQERIMKGEYNVPISSAVGAGNSDSKFESAPFLVLCNRLVSLLTGLVLAQLRPTQSDPSLAAANSSFRSRSWKYSCLPSFLSRLKPASPLLHYALVAAFNNAATLSQYTSLAYLSFTTATLGKCGKMVPVLLSGYFIYGKKYHCREWIGVAVVVTGIWGYLISLSSAAMTVEEHKVTTETDLTGLACLVMYLFFDGLTSTTQEKVFDKSKSGAPVLFGLTEPVMDQMIWVNFFSSLIALQMLLVGPSSTTGSSIRLAMASPALQCHIVMLSFAATCGLLLLFHVIAKHGALIASLIMTLRQFVSVVCNAAWFENFTQISAIGWASIGCVAAGVWIKMDYRYDDSTELSSDKQEIPQIRIRYDTWRREIRWIRQYMVPLATCPLLFLLLVSTMAIFTPSGSVQMNGVMANVTAKPATVPKLPLQVLPPTFPVTGAQDQKLAYQLSVTTGQLEGHAGKPDAKDGGQRLSESGNSWDELVVKAVNADCPKGPLDPVKYNTTVRTALATYPRSGSSYTRALIERATGYQTSCIYCDKPFDEFFKAECDGYNNPWVIKTHFPSELKHGGDHTIHWQQFDQYIEIVRNPIDVIWSIRNLLATHDHAKKLPGVKFTPKSHPSLRPFIQDYIQFQNYWARTPLLSLILRYEDLRRSPAVHLASIIDFLLPSEDLPSAEKMACALMLDEEKEMYKSPKIRPFQDWESHFDRATFEWIVRETAEVWCKWGYDRLLFEERGEWGPVDCMARGMNERVGIDFSGREDGLDGSV